VEIGDLVRMTIDLEKDLALVISKSPSGTAYTVQWLTGQYIGNMVVLDSMLMEVISELPSPTES